MYVPGSEIHVHSDYITWTSSHNAQNSIFKREIIVGFRQQHGGPHRARPGQEVRQPRRSHKGPAYRRGVARKRAGGPLYA